MNELKKYIDELFAHQPLTSEVKDLKDEIYSNMLAKKEDLVNQGISEEEAVRRAKASIKSVDGIIEGNELLYINRFQSECLQTLLLYSTILWLLSIPTLLLGTNLFPSGSFVLIIIFGVIYLISKGNDPNKVAFVNRSRYLRIRKRTWILWAVFFLMCVTAASAVLFGSNIWFSRPVRIDGPYQFGLIAVRYYIPAVTVLIPAAVNSFPGLMEKHIRRETNES